MREGELGFKLLSVDITGNLGKIREVLKEKGGSYPVLLDSESFSRGILHISRTPTTLIIDSDGRIRCRLVGSVENLGKVVEEVLGRL